MYILVHVPYFLLEWVRKLLDKSNSESSGQILKVQSRIDMIHKVACEIKSDNKIRSKGPYCREHRGI